MGFSNLVDMIKEYTYADFVKKQRSVTKLFPTFMQRTKQVRQNGGVRLVEQFPEVWKFKVSSGTEAGKSYDVWLHFKNLPEMIKKYAADESLWTTDGKRANYNALAPEILNNMDYETDCTCPADTFWGPEYVKTQKKGQFGNQEYRPPNVRNPKQHGILCKHGHNVWTKLPFYTSSFAGFLKYFWADEIQAVVDLTKTELEEPKTVSPELGDEIPGDKLAQTRVEEPPVEPEVIEPEPKPDEVEDEELAKEEVPVEEPEPEIEGPDDIRRVKKPGSNRFQLKPKPKKGPSEPDVKPTNPNKGDYKAK